MRKHTLNIETHTNQWLMAEWSSKRWQAVFDVPHSVLRNSFQVSTEQVWPESMKHMRKHFEVGGIVGDQVNSALRLSHRGETRVTMGPNKSLFIEMNFFKKGTQEAFFVVRFGVSKDGEVVSMSRGGKIE